MSTTTTSASDPTQQADVLRREMRSIRREFGDSVEELVENAERLMDWRYYWERYPWAMVGAAALLGYFVVPRRIVAMSMSVDGHSLDDLAHRLAPAITSRVEKKRESKPGWISGLLSLGVGMLTKAATGYATQYVSQLLNQPPEPHQPRREEAHYG